MDKTTKLIFWQRITIGVLLFSLCAAGVNSFKSNQLVQNYRQKEVLNERNVSSLFQAYNDQHRADQKIIAELKRKHEADQKFINKLDWRTVLAARDGDVTDSE